MFRKGSFSFNLICRPFVIKNLHFYCRDSNFQEVALAMFRQKNFFDRWKGRGSMRAGRNNVRWNRTSHPNLYRVPSQNAIQVSSGNDDEGEHKHDSPSKDSKSNSSRSVRRNGRQGRKEDPDVKDLSTISSHDESSPPSEISRRYHIQSVDSSTQTDDHLLRLFLSDIQNDSRQYDSQSNVDGMSQWDYFLLTRNAGILKDNMKNENNSQSGVPHRRPIHIKLQNEDHIYDSCLDITFHNNTSEMSPLLANDHQEASFSDELLVDHEPNNEYFDDLHEFELLGDPLLQSSNLYNGASKKMLSANAIHVNGNDASSMSRIKHRKISEPNNFLCFPESAYRKNLDPGTISLRTHSDDCILRDKVTKLESNGPSSVGNVNIQDTKRDMFVFENSDLDVSTIGRRLSAFSKSSSSAKASPTKTSLILSLEEMSLHGLDALEEEETTLENFRLFLRTKGVNLDLSAVQSSDV